VAWIPSGCGWRKEVIKKVSNFILQNSRKLNGLLLTPDSPISSDLETGQDGCILNIKRLYNKLARTTAVYSSIHRGIMFTKK
jgi:hypothetical protein